MAKIYTKTGDGGETGLWGGDRVPKTHPRVRAYGDVDEANSALGCAIAVLPAAKAFDELRRELSSIQEELFIVGALLATPRERLGKLPPPFHEGIGDGAAKRLELQIDRMTEDLDPMRRFILPGGSPTGAQLHLARAVCRRAEREVVALAKAEAPPAGVLPYLNRLSDYLFVAARWVNHRLKRRETPWQGLAQTETPAR